MPAAWLFCEMPGKCVLAVFSISSSLSATSASSPRHLAHADRGLIGFYESKVEDGARGKWLATRSPGRTKH